MMRRFVCILVLLLSGCAHNVGMQRSQTNPEFHGKIDEISVILLAKKLGAHETQIEDSEFQKIKGAFQKRGIRTDALLYSAMDIDADKKFDDYAAKHNYLLILDPTSMTTGDSVSVTYNVVLLDSKEKKRLWVSNLYVPWGWTVSVFQRFDDMGEQIVGRLESDGLIALMPASGS